MNIYICTKPLQIMICMILNKDELNSKLFVVDGFYDSKSVVTSKVFNKFFLEVKWFPSKIEAFMAAARNKPSNLFLDCDVGLKTIFLLYGLKFLSMKTEINVYEEGIGTYKNDLVKSKMKRIFYNFFGAGCFFGGAAVTKRIYVFDPCRYSKNVPCTSVQVEMISVSLFEWVRKHMADLDMIFSGGFEIENVVDNSEASLYLSDWIFDEDFVKKIANNRNLFIKPHPHIKEIVFVNNVKQTNSIMIPSKIPAEIVIVKLLSLFKKIKVYHKGSSALTYIRHKNIQSIII